MKSFFKCELKFIFWLVIGLIILNCFVYIVTKLIAFSDYFIWIFEGSILVLILYSFYFFYQFFKTLIFKNTSECKNLKQRIASWLSSMV